MARASNFAETQVRLKEILTAPIIAAQKLYHPNE
jgi:hypothetical protein